MKKPRSTLSLVEIAFVMLVGFVASYVMNKVGVQVFALPHLTFLALAVILRSYFGKWKLSDWGLVDGIARQIFTGLLLWLVVQTYYALGHIIAPFFPEATQMGAIAYGITTLNDLFDKLLKIALFKAGTLETFRYFGYAEGLLMQSFGSPLGALMTFVYFGSAHMGIMNLVVLPVSFLFVYFYRTYKIIIPLIIFHILGDAGAFIQMYFSYQKQYVLNYIIFIVFFALVLTFRKKIAAILGPIKATVVNDFAWLKKHAFKAVLISLVLPIWLYILLYIDKNIQA